MKPPKLHIKRPGKDPSSEESSSKYIRTLPKTLMQKKTGKVNSDHAVAEQHATTTKLILDIIKPVTWLQTST